MEEMEERAMSDCRNGGRSVYEPTCTIKISFEGDERLWVYPLALNGRKIESVSIGGVEYEPMRECELEECSWDDGQCTWGVVCTACGYRHERETGTCWNRCPNCGAEVKR